MTPLSIDNIKSIQLGILKEFVSYCDNVGLKYYLAYGTLIGAVRHKGYIPWDDDIDVIMPRPDYERFLSSYKNNRFKIFSPKNHSNCPIPYAKLYDDTTLIKERTDIKYTIGLNIDIFVLDGMPEDKSVARRHIQKCCFWLKIIDIKKISLSSNRKWTRNVILLLLKILVLPFPFSKCISRLVSLSKQYPFEKSSYCSDLSYTGALYMKKSVFGEGAKAEFEGYEYTIPSDFDSWLRWQYGDYMQLPPEEQRVTHHAIQAWLK